MSEHEFDSDNFFEQLNHAKYNKKDRIIEQQAADIDALRGFAQSIVDYLEQEPDYVIESLAVKFGLLEKITVFEPCPYEPCGCKEYCDKDEFREGVECLKRTLILNPNLQQTS